MAQREPRIEFIVADQRVIVDFEKLDCETRDALEERIIEIRKRNSIYFKYPFEEGETNEKWSERVSKLVEEEYARKDGEEVEQHLKRMFNSQDARQTVVDIDRKSTRL